MDRPLNRPPALQLAVRGLHGLAFLVAGVLSFAGWGISGSRSRNSYELVRSVRSLELLDGAWASLAPVWFALPLLLAGGLVAAGYGWRWAMTAIGVFVGILLIVGWWQVKVSPLRVDTAAAASAILGACLIVISTVSIFLLRGRSRG